MPMSVMREDKLVAFCRGLRQNHVQTPFATTTTPIHLCIEIIKITSLEGIEFSASNCCEVLLHHLELKNQSSAALYCTRLRCKSVNMVCPL